MLTYDPNVGFLRNGQRANLHGSVGRNVLDASTGDPSALPANAYDPRYYEAYTDYNGDAGEVTRYRLKPEYADRLGGRTQLQSHSVGGYGEAIDPAQVEWDDEFGLLTSRTNIKDPATPRDNMLGNIAMAAMALPMGYAVALDAGLLGAGASGFPAGAGIAGPSLETAGIATGALEGAAGGAAGAGAASGASLFPPGAGPGIGGPLLETAGAASGSPGFLQQLLANAQANPLMATRALLGAANLANSFGGNSNTTPGLMSGTPGSAPALNFTGLLDNYKPMQFDPVPFMSGRYGG